MKTNYDDIVDKLGLPQWWDENGVPRYCEMHPEHCLPVARQVAFVQIACTHCRQHCAAAVSCELLDLDIQSDLVARGVALYGLMPRVAHCGAPARGEVTGVHSVWRRNTPMIWRQVFP